MSEFNIQDFQQSLELAADLGFWMGLFLGFVLAFISIDLFRYYVVPCLQMILHTERLKRGLKCDCDTCHFNNYAEDLYKSLRDKEVS